MSQCQHPEQDAYRTLTRSVQSCTSCGALWIDGQLSALTVSPHRSWKERQQVFKEILGVRA